MAAPSWLSLLSPLPAEAKAHTKPVASAEQIESGTDGPIAGWQSVTLYLSEPEYGLRHLHITLDGAGTLIAGGDHVMFVRETTPDGDTATRTDHESLGGRFEQDGSFRGTHTFMKLQTHPETDESIVLGSEQRVPTGHEVTALRLLVEDVLQRRTTGA